MKNKMLKFKASKRYLLGKKKILLVVTTVLLLGLIGAVSMLYAMIHSDKIMQNYVHGFDVSHHQDEIAWEKIDRTRYAFVFIKATEGGDYQDPRFQTNWLNAREAGLKVGAYHFFRNCKSGIEQAQNYMRTVPKKDDSLPPVIDLEFQWTCPEVTAEQLQGEIASMAQQLEQHYGQKPIFYTTPKYYQAYIQGKFDGYALWMQDTNRKPSNRDQPPWLFWQYSHQGKIIGINTLVDMNIFRGNRQEFLKFAAPKSQKNEQKR